LINQEAVHSLRVSKFFEKQVQINAQHAKELKKGKILQGKSILDVMIFLQEKAHLITVDTNSTEICRLVVSTSDKKVDAITGTNKLDRIVLAGYGPTNTHAI